MATNQYSDGNVQQISAAGAITDGWLVRSATGGKVGVALHSAAQSTPLQLATEGAFTVDKIAAASSALNPGQAVYARATGSAGRCKITHTATGAIVGYAMAAATTGATSCVVRLSGGI